MKPDKVSIFDLAGVDRVARELRIDAQEVRKTRTLFFKKGLGLKSALSRIPDGVREAFFARIDAQPLQAFRRLDSSTGQATKLLLKTPKGYTLESVILRPSTGRTTLCVSSQVGCAAACRFCATGHMGVAKDLSPAEILAQVTIANEVLRAEDRRTRNIVFMGMGEPLHNPEALTQALTTLQDPAAFDHPASRLLVSTVGIPDELVAAGNRFPRVNYALSLHSADPATRAEIIPLARRYDLAALHRAVEQLNKLQPAKTTVMIEYLMLDGVNDSDAHCTRLLAWANELRVHFNLIPFNPIEDARGLRCSPRSVIESFAARLKAHGFPTTIRHSLGSDIEAACGQLVRSENHAIASAYASADVQRGCSRSTAIS